MKRLALWLLPIALSAGQARYARVGDFDGAVQVQLQAADDWQPARRNLPLRELSWLRTEGPARVEVELDDGSILRLGPDSLAELSDYTRLSTGQRITLISLDHGLAYFTGAAEGKDALVVAVPGAQVTIGQGARLRL
jgi:ferric-dicitrate binding protein FerR (iron transport regulator)